MQEGWSIPMQAMVTARTLLKQRISFSHRRGTYPLWNRFEFKYMLCFKILRKRNKNLGERKDRKKEKDTKQNTIHLIWGIKPVICSKLLFPFHCREASLKTFLRKIMLPWRAKLTRVVWILQFGPDGNASPAYKGIAAAASHSAKKGQELYVLMKNEVRDFQQSQVLDILIHPVCKYSHQQQK